MRKRTIFLIVFVIGVIGLLIFLYWKYELPKKNIYDLTNLSISAKLNGKLVITNYTINYNGAVKNGQTEKSGYVLEQVPKNQTIKIYNININNQTYYTDYKEFQAQDTKRIDFKLEQPQEVLINTTDNTDNLTIILFSKNFQNVIFCVKWSVHFISVATQDFNQTEKPDLYKTWDRCYNANFSLRNNEEKINLQYKIFGILNIDDYIKIAVIDSDYKDGVFITEQDNKDIAGTDKIEKIK